MREQIRPQASTLTPSAAISSSYALTQSHQGIAPKKWIAALAVSLGLAGGLWFTTEARIPQIAHAETVSVGLAIERRNNETYENLLSRAEALAKAAAKESFDQNQEATDVSITVVARHQGAIAPVVSLKVSRAQWLSPAAERGITHFNQARSLLRFDEDIANTNPNSQPLRNNSTPQPQPRNPSTTSPQRTPNSRSSSNQQGVNNGTFTQPGRPVGAPTPGQPTNNVSPGQTGTANPTNPSSGQNPTPGNGLVPQPTTASPAASPNQPQNPTLPSSTGLSPQPPLPPGFVAPANNSSSPTQQNNTSPGIPANSTTTPANNSPSPTQLNNASPGNSTTSNPANTPQNSLGTPTNNGTTPLNVPRTVTPSP